MTKHSIVGYHYCSNKKKCRDFVEKNIPITAVRSKWLGEGMYFWDNPGNARFWKEYQESRGAPKGGLIVRAELDMDHVLDLTDPIILVALNESVGSIVQILRKKRHANNASLSDILNYHLNSDVYRKQHEYVKVIEAAGRYRKDEVKLKDLLELVPEATPHLDFATKIIYCVRHESAISDLVTWIEEQRKWKAEKTWRTNS